MKLPSVSYAIARTFARSFYVANSIYSPSFPFCCKKCFPLDFVSAESHHAAISLIMAFGALFFYNLIPC